MKMKQVLATGAALSMALSMTPVTAIAVPDEPQSDAAE